MFVWHSLLPVIVIQWGSIGERRQWWKGNNNRLLGRIAHYFTSLAGPIRLHWCHYGFFCNVVLSNCSYHGWTCDYLNYCSPEDHFALFINSYWHQHISDGSFQRAPNKYQIVVVFKVFMAAITDSWVFCSIRLANLWAGCIIVNSIFFFWLQTK